MRRVLLLSFAALCSVTGCAPGFLERAAMVPGALKLPSGLVLRTLRPAADPAAKSPESTDRVQVHYAGHLVDGTEFDSSLKREVAPIFPVDHVIPCWTEGLQKMKVGEQAELICPSEIAYGDNGKTPNVPGGATLIFEVELLAIVK